MSAIVMSIVAGIFGTGLGGIVTALLGSRTDKMISIFLSFAGGVMTSIVFFELIPEALAHSNSAVFIIGLLLGVVVVLMLNFIIDWTSGNHQQITEPHESYEEFYHEEKIITGANAMIKSGILMFFVIGLHNIPEGLVIGAAVNHNSNLSVTLAMIIGIHNVPEGMAIAAPLISGGLEKWKTAVLTFLAGGPTVLGAVAGVLLGGISDITLALSFSLASGSMLYAVFGEILPQSISMSKSRIPTMVLLFGIIIGFLMTKM